MAENQPSSRPCFRGGQPFQCKILSNSGRYSIFLEKMAFIGNLAGLLLLHDLTDAGAHEGIGPWRFLNEK
jgi:hypothetical protein